MSASLLSRTRGDCLELAATGSWTADHAHELEPLIDAAARSSAAAASVSIDVARVERLDTFGAWLLERMLRASAGAGRKAEIVGLREHHRDLVAKVHAASLVPVPPVAKRSRILAALENTGRIMVGVGDDIALMVQMVGAVVVAAGRVIVHPTRFRLTSMVHHLERVGWNATPIILLITVLIGAIISQQGIFHFRRFGAEIYVVDMVGILVLREIGVLIVCVMVAGRSGSAYTAELGSMKMREEVDALRTMGFDPIEVLVLPRILALVIAVPLLTFVGSMSALYGGGMVAWLYGGVEPQVFLSRLRDAISGETFAIGMLKAPFMALVIGIVACVEGLQVKGSAESLGEQTTSSVVKSIFLVIVLDGVFAIFFASVGI